MLQAAVAMFGYMTDLEKVEETQTETVEAKGEAEPTGTLYECNLGL